MIDIRDVGTDVFVDHTPKQFYAFCGEEYGVKLRYIAEIAKTHGGRIISFDSVRSVINMLNAERIFPLDPATYIIRYDQSFIKSMDSDTEYELDHLDFDGTIIVMYESESDMKKCDKHIPRYTVRFDPVSNEFVKKYLMIDYPDLDSQRIDIAIKAGHSYIGASMFCESLANLDINQGVGAVQYALSPRFHSSVSAFKNGVAARDFNYCMQIIDASDEDMNVFIYAILNTMLEVEKCIENPKAKSWAVRYAKNWSISDIVIVFQNTYRTLKDSRSMLSYDLYAAIVRILVSMRFSPAVAV